MLNLNRANLSLETVNVAVNDAIERAAATKAELPRPYLGASIVGDECLRKVQFDWWCKPTLSSRVRDIFAARALLRRRRAPAPDRRRLQVRAARGAGVLRREWRPARPRRRHHHRRPEPAHGAYLNYPFLWECKGLNAKNWRAIERDGLEKAFPQYAAQVALYQAYLDVTNPALFTVVNADTCERLHLLGAVQCRACAGMERPRRLPSSRRPALASCCRAPTTIPRTGAAACAATRAVLAMSELLDDALSTIRAAGFEPSVDRNRHWKIVGLISLAAC